MRRAQTRVRTPVAISLQDCHRRAVYRGATRVTSFWPPPFDRDRGVVKLEFLYPIIPPNLSHVRQLRVTTQAP